MSIDELNRSLTRRFVRRGPDGKKSLCNRCGLRWKREMQRAQNAALVVASPPESEGGSADEVG